MKSFDTDLKKYAEKVKLKASERRELRDRVLSYMEYHPLPKKNMDISEKIVSEKFITVHLNTIYTKVIGGVVAIVLIVGVPLAAERSVPGDVLYLIKTGINEGIQAQFANSPYEKVAFETKLLERRISEARLLASEGRLTEEVSAEIAVIVKEHADAAQVGIDALRVENADEAAIAEIVFDSALEVQSAVLDTSLNTNATSSTDEIKNVVQTARDEAMQKSGDSRPSFGGLMARIEMETTRAYELFNSIDGSATEEEVVDIERRLSDIDRKILGAREQNETDEVGAVVELTSSLRLIQKLLAFMTDIDVRELELEILVPIEPTPEERTEEVNLLLAEVLLLEDAIAPKVELIEEEGILEKVNLGMTDLRNLIEGTILALAGDEINSAEAVVADAYALALDLDNLTKEIVVEEVAIQEVIEEEGVPVEETPIEAIAEEIIEGETITEEVEMPEETPEAVE